MTVVLWFVILGWWCMALLDKDTPVVQGTNAHDKLSFPRLVAEALLREQNSVIQQHLLICLGGMREVIGV
jgi:hypothetical protein